MSDAIVLQAARRYVAALRDDPDPMLAPWRAATLGEPELVRTAELRPSYWFVLVMQGDRTLGYVEVGLEGQLLGHSYLYHPPDDLSAVARDRPPTKPAGRLKLSWRAIPRQR